jgi:hypothetical protein
MKKISRKHERTKARNFDMRYTHHDSSGIKLYYETKDDRHQFERLSRKIIGAAIAVH